jgi:cobalt-zinc-cadmium efflux system protein
MHAHDHGSHSSHNSHTHAEVGDRKMLWAVVVNMLLTVAQITGGLFAGSLSLIADALHNFSDAASLGIALAARRIARRPSDNDMTFGYVRAEIVAALINYTTLILVGLYLVYEAILRFIDPQPVAGWLIVIVASVALVVDVVTALLTYRLSQQSMNVRAAFLHNVADALGSVGVIVAGTLIIVFDWRIVDPIVTLAIAGYILWQAFVEIGGAVRILMMGTPPDVAVDDLVATLLGVPGVSGVHHLHVWAIDEGATALEAHIVVENERGEPVKAAVKQLLRERFGIDHSTIELETPETCCEGEQAVVVGHRMGAAHS